MNRPAPDPLADARLVLGEVWGYETFRRGQRRAVRAGLEGRDVLAVLPTGAGKSVCFQLPALIQAGVTLVISPLIALMEDQVAGACRRGMAAVAWCSTTSHAERLRIADQVRQGRCSLLYASPEGLEARALREALAAAAIERIVVDEAHCISEWGHDFRPSYRRIGAIRRRLGNPPLSAFTATATPATRADIVSSLGLSNAETVLARVDRANLGWAVTTPVPWPRAFDRAYAAVRAAGTSIVYAGTRERTVQVARGLRRRGVSASAYHAGLPAADRARRQRDFLSGEIRVMCATSAFGMGIDHPGIRAVVHLGLPLSLEAYVQEAGRGGRDGRPATCTLIRSNDDARFQRKLALAAWPRPATFRRVVRACPPGQPLEPTAVLRRLGGFKRCRTPDLPTVESCLRWLVEIETNGSPGDLEPALRAGRHRALERLDAVRAYSDGLDCRRAAIARYFGEPAPRCHGCDRCAVRHRPPGRGAWSAGPSVARPRSEGSWPLPGQKDQDTPSTGRMGSEAIGARPPGSSWSLR